MLDAQVPLAGHGRGVRGLQVLGQRGLVQGQAIQGKRIEIIDDAVAQAQASSLVGKEGVLLVAKILVWSVAKNIQLGAFTSKLARETEQMGMTWKSVKRMPFAASFASMLGVSLKACQLAPTIKERGISPGQKKKKEKFGSKIVRPLVEPIEI